MEDEVKKLIWASPFSNESHYNIVFIMLSPNKLQSLCSYTMPIEILRGWEEIEFNLLLVACKDPGPRGRKNSSRRPNTSLTCTLPFPSALQRHTASQIRASDCWLYGFIVETNSSKSCGWRKEMCWWKYSSFSKVFTNWKDGWLYFRKLAGDCTRAKIYCDFL